jgi:hypothetical protein
MLLLDERDSGASTARVLAHTSRLSAAAAHGCPAGGSPSRLSGSVDAAVEPALGARVRADALGGWSLGSDRACPGRRVVALLDAREPDSEARSESGQAFGLHVERVAAAELAERLGVGRTAARERRELGEELLEAGGGDDFEDP